MRRMAARARAGALLCALALLLGGPARADEALWQALRHGGYVILIRHAATEPGIGDPDGFRLGECSTQRNLSAEGRAQAKRLGEVFRARRVAAHEVRSSEWCRCEQTARLAFGRAVPWPALNSLFRDASREAQQTREVIDAVAALQPPRNLVLVTHNFNIRALVGISPSTAEIVIARADGTGLQLVGRIPAP
jgi:broad specificity phosphatase PhoE